MIEDLRNQFNEQFSEEQYQAYLQYLEADYGPIIFRMAETPVFIPNGLRDKLVEAGRQIIDVVTAPGYKEQTKDSIPAGCDVPNETPHPHCIAIDFAVTEENGELVPQVIEMQGFPSLYGFQDFASRKALSFFKLPTDRLTYLFNGLTPGDYLNLMRRTFLGDHAPEEVILLEIEPHKQKTRIDFYVTQGYLGIPLVCLSEVIKEGRELFYMRDGQKQRIKRIYNRIIFDELEKRDDLLRQFNMTDDVDVEWASHPNWFFRISKYTLPFLDSPFVPKTYFLHELETIPQDLENWVLKPLFSFAGAGVLVDVTPADIEAIPADQRQNYILMRKVTYAPVLRAPDGGVKVELRLLFLWPDGDAAPTLATTLVRFSRGKMIGVNFNKDKTWVGGSIAFFEHERSV